VLVGGLVVVAVLAVVQLALVLHVRSTLVDSASEGARYGALEGHTSADGAQRTRELITGSLADSFAQDVTATRIERGGVEMVEVRVSAPLPVVGFVGPTGTLTVTGHAIAEDALP
jgi:hypothetical protein